MIFYSCWNLKISIEKQPTFLLSFTVYWEWKSISSHFLQLLEFELQTWIDPSLAVSFAHFNTPLHYKYIRHAAVAYLLFRYSTVRSLLLGPKLFPRKSAPYSQPLLGKFLHHSNVMNYTTQPLVKNELINLDVESSYSIIRCPPVNTYPIIISTGAQPEDM